MVGREGLEPSTNRLKAYCSTIELTAHKTAEHDTVISSCTQIF